MGRECDVCVCVRACVCVCVCKQLDPSAGWEESVASLSSLVLEPAGFNILKISRVPYLCQVSF
jgi:hypothetical protein